MLPVLSLLPSETASFVLSLFRVFSDLGLLVTGFACFVLSHFRDCLICLVSDQSLLRFRIAGIVIIGLQILSLLNISLQILGSLNISFVAAPSYPEAQVVQHLISLASVTEYKSNVL